MLLKALINHLLLSSPVRYCNIIWRNGVHILNNRAERIIVSNRENWPT